MGVNSKNAKGTVGSIQRNASTSQVPNAVRGRPGPEVKSRYMDISSKTAHRAVQPKNDSVHQVKINDQFSSSGTSTRTASPQSRNRPARTHLAVQQVDSHMSMDSLASPKKQLTNRAGVQPVREADVNNSLSRDSLAESIRSSVRTEGTVSQESLHRQPLTGVKRRSENRVTLRNSQKNQKAANGGGSTSGSTSSVGTTGQKGSGRLMRNFSDSGVVFQNTSSKGVSSTSSNVSSTRTSFLSKKSREILERRSMIENKKEANQNGTQETTRRSLPINKSSSTSNIPTHRRIFNTTLHLRKTAEIPIPEKSVAQQGSNRSSLPIRKVDGSTGKPSRIAQKVNNVQSASQGKNTQGGTKKLEKAERDVMSTEKAFKVLQLAESGDMDDEGETALHDHDGFESKMVRSSTFSKDCPDLSQSIEIG